MFSVAKWLEFNLQLVLIRRPSALAIFHLLPSILFGCGFAALCLLRLFVAVLAIFHLLSSILFGCGSAALRSMRSLRPRLQFSFRVHSCPFVLENSPRNFLASFFHFFLDYFPFRINVHSVRGVAGRQPLMTRSYKPEIYTESRNPNLTLDFITKPEFASLTCSLT